MTEQTVTNDDQPAAAAARPAHHVALTILMSADDLAIPPSRHLLSEIDVIAFGRGTRGAKRDRVDGLRRLTISRPDSKMSTSHGRMLRVRGAWTVDDPRSKNGMVVAGRSTRAAPVHIGDVIEIGRTLCVLETVSTSDERRDQFPCCDGPAGLASYHEALVHDDLVRIAPSDVPVLLHGETGSGKEVYGRAIHVLSKRRGPFVAVHCGAVVPSLVESVGSAAGGTLFLDEIHELSPAGQVALLRVLQEREVLPVGGDRAVPVELRIIASSSRPLPAAVDAGRFRDDLYARLLGYTIELPPLRARRVDLALLCRTLEPGVKLTTAAARAIVCYDWPRNIRELERVLATARVLAAGKPVDVVHFPESLREAAERGTIAQTSIIETTGDDAQLAGLRGALVEKLVEHRGNVSAVARDLGEHREQVQRWIRRFELDLAAFRR